MMTRSDEDLLLELLRIPTASPLETGSLPKIANAARLLADAGAGIGLEIAHFESPPISCLVGDELPRPVIEATRLAGPREFLAAQPNLVLRLGPPRDRARTLMFNAHLDTVGGEVPITLSRGRFTGRGAADMKGPAVALLAGLREALRRDPRLTDEITVLVQYPAGEEGGAMGVHGTRVLCEAGFTGRLNVFAEPSGGYFFDCATATMTARVWCDGQDATDDRPDEGHNATLALGFLAQHLARRLDGPVCALGGKLCVAGLHTGTAHNRVYGAGALLLNLAYPTASAGGRIEALTAGAFADGLAGFTDAFTSTTVGARTAADLAAICRLEWLKRGLPALANRDPAMEAVLSSAGIHRLPDGCDDQAFTCDAPWAQTADSYTVVYGPGSLATNGAHTRGEFIDHVDLDMFAAKVADLVLTFRDHTHTGLA
jgi:acetylornithine deacetylase